MVSTTQKSKFSFRVAIVSLVRKSLLKPKVSNIKVALKYKLSRGVNVKLRIKFYGVLRVSMMTFVQKSKITK